MASDASDFHVPVSMQMRYTRGRNRTVTSDIDRDMRIYRDLIEDRKHHPDDWVVAPLVPGETVQRSYGKNYKGYASSRPERDFRLIPEMMHLLEERPLPEQMYTTWAMEHLRNAMNADLPADIRTEHFDIAGIHITRHVQDFSHPAFSLWVKGNGA